MRALSIVGAALIVCACHSSGDAEEANARPVARRDFQVGAFDRIALSGSPDIQVNVGAAPSVRAEGDQELVNRLEVAVENGQLQVRIREGSSNWFSFHHDRGVKLYVTVPSLAGVSIAGSGDVRVDRVQGASFNGSIAGSGDMQIGALAVGEASFTVTGSGDIRGSGHAEHTSVSVTGSGDIDLAGLETGDATLAVAGSGNIGIRATRTAAVEIHGSGDVTVAGPARCTISKAGSGDAHCGGA